MIPFVFPLRRATLPKLVLVLVALLAAPPWASGNVRVESDEAPQQEVKKCGEAMACPSQCRRRDVPTNCCRYLQTGMCFSQAGLTRRQPAFRQTGHRLSDELLAPLLC